MAVWATSFAVLGSTPLLLTAVLAVIIGPDIRPVIAIRVGGKNHQNPSPYRYLAALWRQGAQRVWRAMTMKYIEPAERKSDSPQRRKEQERLRSFKRDVAVGPGKLHQRVVPKFGFLRPKFGKILVPKLGF
ncbi:hypothetical protein DFH06DRAFT_1429241 [Mycena polygramma]|nr:hypothetical protein DFH06DRAFT_1429241 [Mycena polygramma]